MTERADALQKELDGLKGGEEYKATTAPYPIFENVEALAAYLQTTPLTGHHILLKGSRSNQLEKVIPLL